MSRWCESVSCHGILAAWEKQERDSWRFALQYSGGLEVSLFFVVKRNPSSSSTAGIKAEILTNTYAGIEGDRGLFALDRYLPSNKKEEKCPQAILFSSNMNTKPTRMT